ncbi:hypothetical protein D3C76_31320 [compost metagenome]|jgi:hypothetical protein|nr:DUF4023 family protein [Paenibacillus timonensis]
MKNAGTGNSNQGKWDHNYTSAKETIDLMENLHEFVEKVQDQQQKQAKNKKRGHGNPAGQLSTKQHSTQK